MLIGQQVTVLGAGVAGLAVATALAHRGASVRVLEQAPVLGEAGGGLQISPNGAAVLRGLGLGAQLAAAGVRGQAVELRRGADDGLVLRLDLGRLRPGQGYHFLHRADLIDLLAGAARAAGVEIALAQPVEAVDLSGAQPTLRIAGAVQKAGVLIGADGLQSQIRHALNGPAEPFFTGQVAWRAVVPCEPEAAPVASVMMGPGRHLVSYPLRASTLRNIVAVEERSAWAAEGWRLRDDPAALRAAFAGFGGRVPGWLQRVDEVHLWGLFRHKVAARWSGSGAVILGDAAHPMLPFLAQGANMALEDAWVLAECLGRAGSVDQGFAAYQLHREARVRRVVERATANATAYHLRGPLRVAAHLGLRLAGAVVPGLALRKFDWLYGLDVTRD